MPEKHSADSLTPVSPALQIPVPPNVVRPGSEVDAAATWPEYLDPAFAERLIEHAHRAKKAALKEATE